MEGPPPQQIQVVGNQLEDVCFSHNARILYDGQHAAITAWVDSGKRRFSKQSGLLRDIAIRHNVITRGNATAIFLASTDQGTIENNKLIETGKQLYLGNAEPALTADNFAISVQNSKGIKISSNEISAPCSNVKSLIDEADSY